MCVMHTRMMILNHVRASIQQRAHPQEHATRRRAVARAMKTCNGTCLRRHSLTHAYMFTCASMYSYLYLPAYFPAYIHAFEHTQCNSMLCYVIVCDLKRLEIQGMTSVEASRVKRFNPRSTSDSSQNRKK